MTFYMGTTRTRPFYNKPPFTDAINDFVGEVKKYLDHPAILMWGTPSCLHALVCEIVAWLRTAARSTHRLRQ